MVGALKSPNLGGYKKRALFLPRCSSVVFVFGIESFDVAPVPLLHDLLDHAHFALVFPYLDLHSIADDQNGVLEKERGET